MFRPKQFFKLIFFISFLFIIFVQFNACGKDEKQQETTVEKVSKDAGTIHETIAEKTPTEKKQPPPGVGKACISGPRGHNCPSQTALACLVISSNQGICVENCTATDTCTLDSEICYEYNNGYKACFKMANLGEKCSLKDRTVCRGESVDPPEYCIKGVCKARPKDGWNIGDDCSPPTGEQSDCKKGLLCISLSKSLHQCLQKCEKDSDCPSGETCWAKPLGYKVCVIAAKVGEKCDRLERRFCKAKDAAHPVICHQGKCKMKSDYNQLGEDCKQDFDPTKVRGSCDVGMVCLGVAHFKSICHKACKSDSDCPSGEKCALHPNDGKPIKACIIPATKGQTCNLVKRKLCLGQAKQILRCKPNKEDEPEGKCVEVNAGDACEIASDCGPMVCSKVGDKRYCFIPCDPKNPQCPGNGACVDKDGVTVCMPTGPKKLDEPCTVLQGGGAKLNTSNLCVGGISCIPFKKGSPAGVCMKPVAQCTQGACPAGHICIALKNGGLCALDCSKNTAVCKPGTKCAQINKIGKICAPAH